MNRVNFINSVSGIEYPEMLVNFFDQFIALKQLVEDSGTIYVLQSNKNSITFSIAFKNKEIKDNAISTIKSMNGIIVIYNRPIKIICNDISDVSENSIQISLI